MALELVPAAEYLQEFIDNRIQTLVDGIESVKVLIRRREFASLETTFSGLDNAFVYLERWTEDLEYLQGVREKIFGSRLDTTPGWLE